MHTTKEIDWIRFAVFTCIQFLACFIAWELVLSFRSFRSNLPVGASRTEIASIVLAVVIGCALVVAFLEAKLKRSLLKYYTYLVVLAAAIAIWIVSGPSGHFRNTAEPTEQKAK